MEQDRKIRTHFQQGTSEEEFRCFINGDELSHPRSRAEREMNTLIPTCFSFRVYPYIAQDPKPGTETAHSGLGLTYCVNPYNQGKSFTGMPKVDL